MLCAFESVIPIFFLDVDNENSLDLIDILLLVMLLIEIYSNIVAAMSQWSWHRG